MKRVLLAVALFALFPVRTAFAQIPLTMSHQGVLTDVNGIAVPDGNVSLTFRLFDVVSGGTALWEETQQVPVSKGVFNAILGSATPLNLPFDKPYWVGITVAQGTELTPRVELTASPYSLNSHSTVAEPAQGQGLTIRNTQGSATHVFNASGEALHTAKTTIRMPLADGGDTALVIYGSKGPALFAIRRDSASAVQTLAEHSKREVLDFFSSSISGTSYDVGGVGVQGVAASGNGVRGESAVGAGVVGTSGTGTGVVGSSDVGTGVTGRSTSGIGVEGTATSNVGVRGFSENFAGVEGESNHSYGVSGRSNGAQAGVYGEGSIIAGEFNGQVKITTVNPAPTEEKFLVWSDEYVRYRTLPPAFDGVLQGKALIVKSATGIEVFRVDTNGTSEHAGLETFKAGLQTVLSNGNILRISPAEGLTLKTAAGAFRGHMDPNGNGFFAGTLTKGGGSFKIDHPLDPENKYLYHSFVESPDMKNVYDGVVTLDENGEAAVTMPEWFEALNRDFRYQLTAIGAPGPNLHIAEEIVENNFTVAGGKPGQKVSWQVTGIRKDAYAEKHRISVEESKPAAERGRYLHPEAFGLSKEMGVSMLSE